MYSLVIRLPQVYVELVLLVFSRTYLQRKLAAYSGFAHLL
jgi:hypothetical protein